MARKCQKVIWHLRWILLIVVMIFNVYGFFNRQQFYVYVSVNVFSFALYFLLGQLDGYFECKSNCHF